MPTPNDELAEELAQLQGALKPQRSPSTWKSTPRPSTASLPAANCAPSESEAAKSAAPA